MNALQRVLVAARVGANQAVKMARLAYRRPDIVANRYEAAYRSSRRSYIPYTHTVGDYRFDATESDRSEIMRKARFFEANNPLIQRLADLWELHTVGANGLAISPLTNDFEWAARQKEWYSEWALAPDVCSLHSLTTCMSLASRLWCIDGEAFILLTRTRTAPYRPRIQLLESHRVGTPPQYSSREGMDLIDGVQIDSKGKPIGYWVRDSFTGDNYTFVAAENMIHIMEPSRQGQYRGVSMFYAVMNVLHDLDDLAILEMDAAKDAAKTTKIIKTPSGELPDDGWEEADVQSAGAENPQKQYYERVFGAGTKVLFSGDEYNQFVSNRPSVAQQWYWRYLAEQVCIGSIGVPLVLVYPDSMQGTVYRGVLDMAAQTLRARSAVMQDAALRIWRYATEFQSRVDVNLADKPEDWMKAAVRPPRAANVDVGRNSSAMLAELEAGTRTLADIFSEIGEDWQEKVEQKAMEMAFVKRVAAKYKVEPQEVTKFALKSIEEQARERKILEPEVGKSPKPTEAPEGSAFYPVINISSGGGNPYHDPDDGRFTTGPGGGGGTATKEKAGKVKTVSERAWNGEQVKVSAKLKLPKGETGKIGERLVLALNPHAKPANSVAGTTRNNYATDIVDPKSGVLIEVKAGQATNGETAWHWRATIGETSKTEKAFLKKMSKEQKKEYHAKKQKMIMARKSAALAELSKKLGKKLKPQTFTFIVNPKTRTADVFKFDGFHERIPWKSDMAKRGYVKTVKY